MAPGNLCRPLQLVPGKGLAIDSALERLQQYRGEQLAVREPLQPEVEQQMGIFALSLLSTLQEKSQRGCHEVNEQKDSKKEQQALETAGVRTFRMEVPVRQISQGPKQEHQVNGRRQQRKNDLENDDVGQGNPAEAAAPADCGSMFPDRLQYAK